MTTTQISQITHLAAAVVNAREYTAREEIDRLRAEIHDLVTRSDAASRDTIDEAVFTAALLQVVTSNLDASKRPGPGAGRALVAVADDRLRRYEDAIERGMAYTADATLRRFHGENPTYP